MTATAATIEDFLKVFEDASGRDLSQFALWYQQAGTPNLASPPSHDAAASDLHRSRSSSRCRRRPARAASA